MKTSGEITRVRAAFTLIELLVVIAIIGILTGLILAAVQSARSAARLTVCSNQLRQMGLAVQTFQSAHQVFPASGWTQAGPGNPAGKYVGWRALILPFVEQDNLHRLYDFSTNWWEGTNLAAAAVPILLFECPDVPSRKPVTTAVAHPPRPAMTFANPIAPTDYEAIMGLKPSAVNPHLATPRYNANNRLSVMHRNSRNRLTDIPDGTSQTIMVVECGGRPDVWRAGRLDTSLSNDQGIGWADSEGAFSLDFANADGSAEGLGPVAGCTFPMNRRNDNEPYSFHASGANFLFADGKVKFLSESIDLETMAALVTRSADDPVTDLD